jgi:hypothetical protein
VICVITITGFGDHVQPVWLITFTGMRTFVWTKPADAILAKVNRLSVPSV